MSAKSAMISLEIDELTTHQKEYLFNKHSKVNFQSRKSTSAIFSKYLTKIDEVLKSFKHHDDIIIGFEEIKFDAQKELIGQELESILILLSVGKKSSKFWLPVESGGDGIGYKFLTRKRIGKNSSITADW